ncbi:DNA adenine methylase [Pseudothauera hydrothermalis]|uniref:DNA adenine methylase n=1 Tax=Pseudothauera hydrothermalis TaxID=2184083 RepID=UPI0013C2A39B|nr:DNA adenine methylase [Pseudothauera hydrothermalis]
MIPLPDPSMDTPCRWCHMAGEAPVAPFLNYVGGKRRLAKRIVAMLPEHVCYCEPFGGMGAVLLAKPRSKVEVWNDIDGGLANVMRIVRYHPDALADELRWMLVHRAERLRWLKDAPGETDIQRAARWIMVRHSGFQGSAGKGFHVGKATGMKPRDTLIEQMFDVSRRLSGVSIECLPWQRVIDLYDAPGTVFFCDPPYADGDQECYEHAFTEADHLALRDRLRAVKGRWILTYGDHPLIRDLYADCHIEEVRRWRTLNQAAKREYVELIITP